MNSKDSPDLWGGKNVSRVIVGGTQAEAGLATIGIAQSIDPGNFATQETAWSCRTGTAPRPARPPR